MKNNRLLELDALRGIAALAVVFYHYFYRYNEVYNHSSQIVHWLYFGKYGAQFFFIISGFVIYWTLNRVEKPADFLVSRFSRLYPVYWMAVIITFTVVLVFGLPGKQVPFGSAVTNLMMFHEYFNIPHVDGVYWTLTVELTFYFWAFTLYLLKQLDRAEFFMVPVLIMSLLQSLNVVVIPEILDKFFITNHVSFFIAGICFFKIAHKKTNRFTVPVLIFSLLCTASIISIKHCILFSFFYVIFYLAVTGKFRFLSFKPFVFLGAVSYSLYLLHQNIGFIIINKFYAYQLNPVYGAFLSLILCVFAASLLNKYVEKPFLSLIRNFYKRNKKIQRIAVILSFNKEIVSGGNGVKSVKKRKEISSIG